MKPLQVMIPEDELARLDRWSKKRGWTKSQAVRFALRALTQEQGLLGASGMIEGLPADLSERFDAYLAEAQALPPISRRGRRARHLRRQ